MTNTKVKGFRKVLRGVVLSNKMAKTVTVQVTNMVRHSEYNKFIKTTKKYHAHDANNAYAIGDTVMIKESAPISKTKRWVVTKLIESHKE